MSIAGVDYSTRFVDIVLLDEDTDAATWHRFPLEGRDAFDRARRVRDALRPGWAAMFDDVIAVGIEDPRGYNAGALYRVQGAILSRIRADLLVHPLVPSEWRKAVGLPGNASKRDIADFVDPKLIATNSAYIGDKRWPQDACDAYCIALATRSLIQVSA